jgi:SNF2 family DNA or RNA helicase
VAVSSQAEIIDAPDPSYALDETDAHALEIYKAEPASDDNRLALRSYQQEAVQRILLAEGRILLAYQMGLGKTAVALKSISGGLMEGVRTKEVIIICPKIAFGVWESETLKWLGEDFRTTIFTGNPAERERRFKEFKDWNEVGRPLHKVSPFITKNNPLGVHFLITNFAQMAHVLEKQRVWGAIIVDEGHFLKNLKTKAFKNAKKFISPNLLILTGSPVVNGVQDLWTLLHLLKPREFKSYWDFVHEHCNIFMSPFGPKILGPKDPPALREVLKPYVLRKTKEQVLRDLPPKIRQAIPITLTDEQYTLYQQVAKEMIAEIGPGEFLLTPNRISQIVRLRQILVNPVLVGGPNSSAMFEALKESVALDFEAKRSVLIFTPFAKALPLIAEELKGIVDFQTIIRGGMKEGEVPRRIKAFQEHPSHKCALLCSLLVGSSFTATKASVVYFCGYDFVPSNNFQAEDRTHRMGQKNSVHVKYFMCKGSIDSYIMAILNKKVTWANLALDLGVKKLLLPDSAKRG